MPVGHTKFNCDSFFGHLKSSWKNHSNEIYNLIQLEEITKLSTTK